jgi:hypothetical protein
LPTGIPAARASSSTLLGLGEQVEQVQPRGVAECLGDPGELGQQRGLGLG